MKIMQWICLFFVGAYSGSILSDDGTRKYCFNESERVTLYYTDFPTEAIPLSEIPSFTVHTGGWDSQHLSNIIGYILLNEKLGLNTSMFPTFDYSTYWSHDTDYPQNFYKWTAEKSIDIFFEMMTFITPDDLQVLINNGSCAISENGVLLSQGFYIPDYLAETYPATLTFQFWNNTEFREYYVNETKRVNYDNGTIDVPQVYHSFKSYQSAIIMEGLMKHYGIKAYFNYSGSELANDLRIVDLYNKSIPFVCYSYTPYLLPALVPLQRMRFPDNPSERDNDPCLDKSDPWCDMPISPYHILWREDAVNDWPEVRSFLIRMKFSRTEVNEMISYAYFNGGDYFGAACEWLKNNSETWESWIPPINKYKCGKNGEFCLVGNKISTVLLTIYGLSGLVALILLIWIVYKIVGFCKEFQSNFGNVDEKENKLLQKEKQRLFISVITDFMSSTIGLTDFATDLLALIAILTNADQYAEWFMLMYFIMTIFSSFASTAHLIVTIKNIFKDVHQLKTGILDISEYDTELASPSSSAKMSQIVPESVGKKNEIVPESPSSKQLKQSPEFRKMNTRVFKKTHRELKKLQFKMGLISNKIKQQSTTIFVAFIEDIPFATLNIIAILNNKNNFNLFLFISLLVNTVSIGFKLCVSREFFSNLNQKSEIKDSIRNFQMMHDDARKSFMNNNEQ